MPNTDTLVAVCNFILEERPYTVEALTNELFLYVNFVESVSHAEIGITFEFKDGVLIQPDLPFRRGEIIRGSLTSDNKVKVVTKGSKLYRNLVLYRNMRNSVVGI